MTKKMYLYFIMVMCCLLLLAAHSLIQEVSAESITIEYSYSPVGIAQEAVAKLDDGTMIGKAELEELVKGEYYLVHITQYSPQTGSVVYRGRAKFSIYGGMKMQEKKITGNKIAEIFSTWPSGGFGF